MASTTSRIITGSCLCKRIKYEASIPSGPLTANKCNCTFCGKRGVTNFRLSDASAFKLLSPSSVSEIADYSSNTPGKGHGHRYFCSTCGVHVWMDAQYELQGKTIDMFTINFATVDQPQEGVELNEVKINYVDGLNNNFMNWQDKPWSGGLV